MCQQRLRYENTSHNQLKSFDCFDDGMGECCALCAFGALLVRFLCGINA